MNFVNLFISPSGRINRAQFWIAIMVFVAASLLVVGLSFAIGILGYLLIEKPAMDYRPAL